MTIDWYWQGQKYKLDNPFWLRSDPENRPGSTARIEVYFGNVEYLAVRPLLEGVNIRRASEDERQLIFDQYGIEPDTDYVFILNDGPPLSFVVSGEPAWREAVRAADAPSLFEYAGPWPPGPEVRWGFLN